VLQCVAVCCSVRQCVAVYGSLTQCGAVCGSVWQYVAVCCSVAVCCDVLQRAAETYEVNSVISIVLALEEEEDTPSTNNSVAAICWKIL